jgi:hypothetical protein
MAEASSHDRLQCVVREAFPDQPPGEIDRDVAAAVEEMAARGLVISVP